MVAYLLQRQKLPLQRGLLAHRRCHLIIFAPRIVHGDEIHLLLVHLADVYRISAAQKLQIYDVLKDMPHVGIARAEQRIAQPYIHGVVFFHRFQILFPPS